MSMSRGRSYRLVVNNNNEEEEDASSTVVRRRNRPMGGGVSVRGTRALQNSGRRISCADLGIGTHQGWLRQRKPRKTKWEECHKWCVLKDGDLFVYASKMDTSATSRIHLAMFSVSDAPEAKKTGAFKIHNTGTTFYFRSKTDIEKYEWINHLSLVAIGYNVKESNTYASTASSTGTHTSTASSSGVDSSYSTSNSQAYSDADETDSCDDLLERVPMRTNKYSSMRAPDKLKSIIDVNRDMRRMVTSIREADLDLVGTGKEARVQSQLRKSMAHAGYTSGRQNSAKNKRVFMQRAKERQKQAYEQELADIEELLAGPSRAKLYDFLSHYPDYQDGINLDTYPDADQSSSARSSNNPEHTLTSIDSTHTVTGAECMPLTDQSSDGIFASNQSIDRLSADGHLSTNRQTLTPDFDLSQLDLGQHTLDSRSHSSCDSNRSSKDPIYIKKQKYKQTVTSL